MAMTEITYQELVITCEACQHVKKIPVQAYEECLEIFNSYKCPNGCGRNLYSFFTVGKLEKKGLKR